MAGDMAVAIKINSESKMVIKTSGCDSDRLIQASARIEQPRLHLTQSMINMQSLMYGGANGEYNNPRHR
jgi:hypothetical protein